MNINDFVQEEQLEEKWYYIPTNKINELKLFHFENEENDLLRFNLCNSFSPINKSFNNDIYSFPQIYVVNKESKDEWGWGAGYAIIKNNELIGLIGVYEPHIAMFNGKHGVLTCVGHETVSNLYVDDFEFELEYTR